MLNFHQPLSLTWVLETRTLPLFKHPTPRFSFSCLYPPDFNFLKFPQCNLVWLLLGFPFESIPELVLGRAFEKVRC